MKSKINLLLGTFCLISMLSNAQTDSAFKTKNMNEVKVVAKKQLVTQEIDRIVYHLQDDPDSKAFNLLDMMRKVPFISVTADDQIQLKGTSNFKVLLDGKSSSILSSRSLKDVLKGIPASSILQIEVITTPPAKYESEGLAGIINIITNRKLKDGYNLSFNGNYSNLFSGISGSQNIKKGKVGISAFEGTSWERTPSAPFSLSVNQHSPDEFELNETGNRRYNGNNIYGSAMVTYEPDTLNMFTVNLGLNKGLSRLRIDQLTQVLDDAGALERSYALDTRKKNTDDGYNAELNYQRGFRRNKAQLLTLSFRHLTSNGAFNNSNSAAAKLNYELNDFIQTNKSGLTENTMQVDYAHPLKKVTIEGGSKLILRNKFSDFVQENFNPNTQQFEPYAGSADAFNYGENIFGFYNSYYIKKKKWAVRAGFRVEITDIHADFETSAKLLDRSYTNVVPSVTFLYKLKNAATTTVGYTQRIQRPGISLLNPFEDATDPGFRRVGNPNLLPVRTHNFTWNYTRFKKSSIAVGLTGAFSKNTIQSIASSTGGDSVIRISYQNVGRYTNIGSNINLTIPLGKMLTLTANGNLNYVWIEGTIDNTTARNSGLEGLIYSYLSCRAKKNWRFSINGGFYGPTRNLQGNSNSYFYSSASVSKQIFKQKGNLSLSVSNPFTTYRTLNTVTHTAQFDQRAITKNYYRNINISFYYRLGKLSEEIKKSKKSVNNDDKAVETGKAQ